MGCKTDLDNLFSIDIFFFWQRGMEREGRREKKRFFI